MGLQGAPVLGERGTERLSRKGCSVIAGLSPAPALALVAATHQDKKMHTAIPCLPQPTRTSSPRSAGPPILIPSPVTASVSSRPSPPASRRTASGVTPPGASATHRKRFCTHHRAAACLEHYTPLASTGRAHASGEGWNSPSERRLHTGAPRWRQLVTLRRITLQLITTSGTSLSPQSSRSMPSRCCGTALTSPSGASTRSARRES